MTITIEDVRRIAKLARIKLTGDEEKRHAVTMSAVLDYMKILNEVDTSAVSPTVEVIGLSDVSRPDTVVPYADREKLLETMPKTKRDRLVVPAVFENTNEE